MTVGYLGRSSPLWGRPRFLGIGSVGADATAAALSSVAPSKELGRLGGGVCRHLAGGLLPGLDLGRIPSDVPNELVPQLGADQCLVDPRG